MKRKAAQFGILAACLAFGEGVSFAAPSGGLVSHPGSADCDCTTKPDVGLDVDGLVRGLTSVSCGTPVSGAAPNPVMKDILAKREKFYSFMATDGSRRGPTPNVKQKALDLAEEKINAELDALDQALKKRGSGNGLMRGANGAPVFEIRVIKFSKQNPVAGKAGADPKLAPPYYPVVEVYVKDSSGKKIKLKTMKGVATSGTLGPKTQEGDLRIPEMDSVEIDLNKDGGVGSQNFVNANVGYNQAGVEGLGGQIKFHGVKDKSGLPNSTGCVVLANSDMAQINRIIKMAGKVNAVMSPTDDLSKLEDFMRNFNSDESDRVQGAKGRMLSSGKSDPKLKSLYDAGTLSGVYGKILAKEKEYLPCKDVSQLPADKRPASCVESLDQQDEFAKADLKCTEQERKDAIQFLQQEAAGTKDKPPQWTVGEGGKPIDKYGNPLPGQAQGASPPVAASPAGQSPVGGVVPIKAVQPVAAQPVVAQPAVLTVPARGNLDTPPVRAEKPLATAQEPARPIQAQFKAPDKIEPAKALVAAPAVAAPSTAQPKAPAPVQAPANSLGSQQASPASNPATSSSGRSEVVKKAEGSSCASGSTAYRVYYQFLASGGSYGATIVTACGPDAATVQAHYENQGYKAVSVKEDKK